MGAGHCVCVLLPVIVESVDAGEEFLTCDFLFFQNHTESLTLKRAGVQDLIAPACICRERDQKIWLVQCQQFTAGIGPRPGDDNVCQGEQVFQLVFNIFILYIAVQII